MDKETFKKAVGIEDSIREHELKIEQGENFLKMLDSYFQVKMNVGNTDLFVCSDDIKPFLEEWLKKHKAAIQELRNDFERL